MAPAQAKNYSLPESAHLRSFLIDSPVGLVIVSHAGRTEAIPISSFSEAAHHPTTMWISVERANAIHEMLAEAGRFVFVTLHSGQAELASGCGPGRIAAGLEFYEFTDGFRFVREALACVACRITRSEPAGDHTLFIAEMLAGVTHSRCSVMRPLLLSDLGAR
jgi:flavin reductase (DIM6/NTAB) family NADH-FMN oxidoreductase RutF